MKYKKHRWQLGPNPDPTKFQDVKTDAGWYRRRIRSQGTEVNEALQEHNDAMKLASPAAKRVRQRLAEWLEGMKIGSLQAILSGALSKSYRETGVMTFEHMLEKEMQPHYPLDSLLIGGCQTKVVKGQVVMEIHLIEESLRLTKSIYTDYFFEAVLLWGDPMKLNGLRVDSQTSKLYPKILPGSTKCVMKLDLPSKKAPWMALLKVNCMEGNEMAKSNRHYAMKVVAVAGF
jgi:hypothetical protein